MVLSLIFPCAGAHFRDSFLAWRPIASPGVRLSGAKAYVRCPSSQSSSLPRGIPFCASLIASSKFHGFVATAPVLCVKVLVANVEGPGPLLGLAVTELAREASIPDPI